MKLLLLGIFVSDWRRKLTALGLAFALWLWVDGLVAEQQPHTLRIVISPVERAVEPGTLQIRVPEGWTLTAGPGTSSIDEVQFSLFGSAAQIEAFLATGFSASFDPELDRAERQDRVNMSILVSDLQWSRPDQADTLLADSESDRSLSFQFVKLQTVAIELGPHLFNIEGGVADGYIALDKELSFDLSEIRIVGPSTTLGPTFGKINDRLDAFESGDMDLVQLYPPLLEALVLDGQRRDMHVELRLHPNHVRAGIRLVEGRVSVDLPVRLLDPDPRPIPLEADMLTIVPDPEGEWEAPVWSQTNIRINLSSQPKALDGITGDWLFKHLVFILPLDRIPDSALEQDDYELPIEWTLVGLEEELKTEVLRRLSVSFEDPSKRTVLVQRKR